jgi:hypothetical protein
MDRSKSAGLIPETPMTMCLKRSMGSIGVKVRDYVVGELWREFGGVGSGGAWLRLCRKSWTAGTACVSQGATTKRLLFTDRLSVR